MKLTKEALDKLIVEEVERLNEKETVRINIPIDNLPDTGSYKDTDSWKGIGNAIGANSKGTSAIKNHFKATKKQKKEPAYDDAINTINKLASNDKNPKDLSNLDLDAASGDDELAIKNALASAPRGTPWANYKTKVVGDPQGKAAAQNINRQGMTKPPEDYKPSGISFPRMYTAPADENAAKHLGSQNQLVKAVFSQNTIAGRIKKLDEITAALYTGEFYESNKNKPRELLQAVMMMDLMNFMAKEVTGYGGGYFFETFCALICGGNVVGGDMGVADFQTNDGSLGSSKYYQKYYDIKQASAGFEENKPVHYIMAIKKTSEAGEQKSAVTATGDKETKAQKIHYIDLHYIVVNLESKTNATPPVGKFKLFSYGGEELAELDIPMESNSDIVLTQPGTDAADPLNSYVGTLRFTSGNVPWSDAVQQGVDAADGKSKEAFKHAKDFFGELFKAEEASKSYISMDANNATDILAQGNAALDGFDRANIHLEKLLNILAPSTQKVKQAGTMDVDGTQVKQRKISEKLTEELLDKLIKAVIL